ncbi:MAG: ribosome silencing factor [Kiritimatiellae bacterium]|nr:ribosome silencing factor [Kiritimatiellia bacterium]
MTARQQAMALKEALKNAKGIDIKVYDVRGESSLADYFVVATGAAAPHLKALVAAAQAAMKAKGVMSYRVSGESDSGWVVADYVDVVLHVFSAEARAYYALEAIWSEMQKSATSRRKGRG